jgi:hypothetical protein
MSKRGSNPQLIVDIQLNFKCSSFWTLHSSILTGVVYEYFGVLVACLRLGEKPRPVAEKSSRYYGTGWVKPNHVAKSFIVRLFNLSSHVRIWGQMKNSASPYKKLRQSYDNPTSLSRRPHQKPTPRLQRHPRRSF